MHKPQPFKAILSHMKPSKLLFICLLSTSNQLQTKHGHSSSQTHKFLYKRVQWCGLKRQSELFWRAYVKIQWWPAHLRMILFIGRRAALYIVENQMVQMRVWSSSWHLLIGGRRIPSEEILSLAKRCWNERPATNLSWNESNGNLNKTRTLLLKYCEKQSEKITWIERILQQKGQVILILVLGSTIAF